MQTLVRPIAIACLCAVLSACGSASGTPLSTPAQPTASPTPGVATPPATTAPIPTSPGAPTTLVVDPSATKVSYHAHEQLVGRDLPSEAVGTSSAVSGSIAIAPDGSILADQSQISVDLRQLTSDESRRDNFIKSNTLQTSRYPTATFVAREVSGLPNPLPNSGQATFQLSGDLTVHGVTRAVTWQVTTRFGDSEVSGDASTQINISDFGMTPPKAGPVLSIQDGVTLELAFRASRQA